MNTKRIILSQVLLSPIVSEKSTIATEKNNHFVFRVQKMATKIEIKEAVEIMFDVQVEAVKVLNVKGKVKRFGGVLGKRSGWKKAYVNLKSGQDIDFSSTTA